MPMEMKKEINYKQTAYLDVRDLMSGKIDEAEFIKRFKQHAPKSSEYTAVISDLSQASATIYDDKLAKSVGLRKEDFGTLPAAGGENIARKLIPALFKVAYTTTPNKQLTDDGKPAPYEKRYNTGYAAAQALGVLGSIEPGNAVMKMLYDEYFYPQTVSDNGKSLKLKYATILNNIRKDFQLCKTANVKENFKTAGNENY